MYNQRQAKGVSSAEYILQRGTASENGVFPCLFPRSGKAVSKLYREKIDQLQAAEQRLLEQKAEAMQRAGEAGQAADAALRSDAERTCTAIRQQAEQRMDTAVHAIVEKVVKR